MSEQVIRRNSKTAALVRIKQGAAVSDVVSVI